MILHELIFDYTLRNVALGSAMLGIVSGFLGTIVVLKKQSLLGDAMSHAALPGIALAFIVFGTKNISVLLLGAGITAFIATGLIYLTTKNSKIKFDSSLAIWLSTFFGLGLVLLTIIQRYPNAQQAGLDKFLFGQAAALTQSDVTTMFILGAVSISVVILFWKEIKILIFDPGFGTSLGLKLRFMETVVIALIIVAILIGLQTVGVVLMSSMLIAPAVAARQWTDRLSTMVMLSAFFGIIAGICGSVFSSKIAKMPTGPAIIVSISFIVLISVLFSHKYGLITQYFIERRSNRNIKLNRILEGLLNLSVNHKNPYHPHSINVLRFMGYSPAAIRSGLENLSQKGLVLHHGEEEWALTEAGYKEVENNIKNLVQ